MLNLKETAQSPFFTSRRNKMLYWLANLAVFPAFMLSIYFAGLPALRLFPTLFQCPICAISLVVALGLLSTDVQWHIAYPERTRLYIASLLIITVLLWADSTQSFPIFLFLFLIIVLWCIFFLVRNRGWIQLVFWTIFLILGMLAFIYAWHIGAGQLNLLQIIATMLPGNSLQIIIYSVSIVTTILTSILMYQSQSVEPLGINQTLSSLWRFMKSSHVIPWLALVKLDWVCKIHSNFNFTSTFRLAQTK